MNPTPVLQPTGTLPTPKISAAAKAAELEARRAKSNTPLYRGILGYRIWLLKKVGYVSWSKIVRLMLLAALVSLVLIPAANWFSGFIPKMLLGWTMFIALLVLTYKVAQRFGLARALVGLVLALVVVMFFSPSLVLVVKSILEFLLGLVKNYRV